MIFNLFLVFFKDILISNSKFIHCVIKDIISAFNAYGPGLVSTFEVYQDFYIPGKFTYYGSPKGNKLGLHSMAIIGIIL